MKALLERINLTETRLAQLAKVHRNTLGYGKTKSGNQRNTSPQTLRKVADALVQHAKTIVGEAETLRKEAARRDPNAPEHRRAAVARRSEGEESPPVADRAVNPASKAFMARRPKRKRGDEA